MVLGIFRPLHFQAITAGLPRRVPAVLLAASLVSGLSTLLAGCGASSEKTVLASQRETSSSDRQEEIPASFTEPLGPLHVPSDTAIRVRSLQSISSSSASPGDEFEAELIAPISVDGRLAFPKGSRVRGRVANARPSGKEGNPGYLQLTVDAIQSTDGKWHPISTTTVSARGKPSRLGGLSFSGAVSGLGMPPGYNIGTEKSKATGGKHIPLKGAAGVHSRRETNAGFSAESKLTFLTIDTLVLNR